MRGAARCGVAAALWLAAAPAHAGPVLDRVRHDRILHCAAVERPGYAEIENGVPSGRAADLCRATAAAILGQEGRFELRLLDLDADFDRVRRGEAEIVFLGPRVVTEQGLAPTLTPLRDAYADRFVVMLPERSAGDTLADLKGQTIRFMIGDPVWPLLQDGLKARHVAFRPFGFSEEVEMKDAYNVGRCAAMAGPASTLDALREDTGVKHLRSRFIPEPLGADPVMAYTPSGDPAWEEAARTAASSWPRDTGP